MIEVVVTGYKRKGLRINQTHNNNHYISIAQYMNATGYSCICIASDVVIVVAVSSIYSESHQVPFLL